MTEAIFRYGGVDVVKDWKICFVLTISWSSLLFIDVSIWYSIDTSSSCAFLCQYQKFTEIQKGFRSNQTICICLIDRKKRFVFHQIIYTLYKDALHHLGIWIYVSVLMYNQSVIPNTCNIAWFGWFYFLIHNIPLVFICSHKQNCN